MTLSVDKVAIKSRAAKLFAVDQPDPRSIDGKLREIVSWAFQAGSEDAIEDYRATIESDYDRRH